MRHLIKTPNTTAEHIRTARNLDMLPSELMDLFTDALGESWMLGEPQELTIIRDAPTPAPESWNPHLNPWQRPAPETIPPGFEPLDAEWDIFVGKRMEGARWKIVSEYVLHTRELSLTCWTTDDDPMTATEVAEYAEALLTMGAYITTMENLMAVGAEATQVAQAAGN